jgi:sulfate transport system ATP-binding protein
VDGVAATVTRVVRLGFEVRVEMTARGDDVWAQVTRAEADALGLAVGDEVSLCPRPGARSLDA